MDYRIDMRHCRRLLRNGSRSFFVASWLLPAFYRAPATALYAFCRVADDAVDARMAGVAADVVAAIVYTSGTTGVPKGAVLVRLI